MPPEASASHETNVASQKLSGGNVRMKVALCRFPQGKARMEGAFSRVRVGNVCVSRANGTVRVGNAKVRGGNTPGENANSGDLRHFRVSRRLERNQPVVKMAKPSETTGPGISPHATLVPRSGRSARNWCRLFVIHSCGWHGYFSHPLQGAMKENVVAWLAGPVVLARGASLHRRLFFFRASGSRLQVKMLGK